MPVATMRPNPELLRRRFNWVESLSDAELRRVALLGESEVLLPGEEYLDLSHPEQGPFKGHGDLAPSGSAMIQRRQVGEDTWHKLVSLGEPGEVAEAQMLRRGGWASLAVGAALVGAGLSVKGKPWCRLLLGASALPFGYSAWALMRSRRLLAPR